MLPVRIGRIVSQHIFLTAAVLKGPVTCSTTSNPTRCGRYDLNQDGLLERDELEAREAAQQRAAEEAGVMGAADGEAKLNRGAFRAGGGSNGVFDRQASRWSITCSPGCVAGRSGSTRQLQCIGEVGEVRDSAEHIDEVSCPFRASEYDAVLKSNVDCGW